MPSLMQMVVLLKSISGINDGWHLQATPLSLWLVGVGQQEQPPSHPTPLDILRSESTFMLCNQDYPNK